MVLTPLVLIPGLLNDGDLWRDQLPDLADVALPTVADITNGATLSELAAAVLSQAPSERFAMVGFSLGGIVALEVIRIAPQRISHLALLDTTMLPDSGARYAERMRLVSLVDAPGKFHGFGDKLIQAYFASSNVGNKAMADRVRTMAARLGPEVFRRQSLIERPDSRQTLATIRCPTLVLCGEDDQVTPSSLHRGMAAMIANADLRILEGAGHMTPIERPQAVAGAIRGLIARP